MLKKKTFDCAPDIPLKLPANNGKIHNSIKSISRQKAKGRRTCRTFTQLPHDVIDHEDFINLSHRATRLLLDLARQYNGYNNGDLCATFSMMKKRGWTSNDQRNKALKELVEKDFIRLTRQGGKNSCNLFAVTWLPVDITWLPINKCKQT